MVSILRKGYKLVFIETPKLSPVPILFQPPKLPQKVILLEMEINKLIEKRAVEFAPPGTPGYYSHMFLVSKGENKWRPIIDLSVLNTMLWIPSFHMETPESIRTAIQLNNWTVSIDLSDAFLHIPVNVQDRKYLRFAYKCESLQFRALPFGLATSPWLFTQIMIEVKIMALQKGIIIHQYLDDWLIRSQSKQVLLNQTEWLLALCSPRAENKHRKIRVDTNKGFHFCGLPVQNPDKQGLPHTEENRANTTESNIISQFSGSPSKTMAISYRSYTYGNREASPNGKNSHERFTVLSKTSVEADGNESQSVSSNRPPSTHRASVVVRYDKSHSGSPHAPSESGHSDFHGLLNGGLGSPYTEPGSVRGMVAQRENITHKQFRATGSSSSSKTLGESCHWENNTCSQRQLNRGCLCQQAGRHSIKITVHGSKRNVDLVPSEGNNSPCKIYSRKAQCSSRSVEQEGANSPHRVVPLSQDFQTVMQPVHQTHVGLVCNKIQQETGNLCISNAGPRIRSCRCPVTQLGEHVGLCISTNSPDSPDSDKDTDRGLSDHANSTRLRKGTVVPDTVKPNSGSPSGSATKQKSAKATKRSNIYHKNPKSLDLHSWILSRDQYKQRDFLKTQPDASQNQYEDPLMQYTTASGESSRLGVVKGKLIRSKSLFTE